MRRNVKTNLAIVLSTTILVTSLSLTSLAKLTTSGTIESDDYYLVTLDAGEGGSFKNPFKYTTKKGKSRSNLRIATGSNVATGSDVPDSREIIEETGTPGTTTVFAVEDSTKLSLEDIKSAAEDAQFTPPEKATTKWLEKKGDFDTEITGDIKLTGNKTIYAAYGMQADTTGCTVLPANSVESFSDPKSRIISTQNVRTLEPPVCQEIIGPAQ